jgi:hypothetical protein
MQILSLEMLEGVVCLMEYNRDFTVSLLPKRSHGQKRKVKPRPKKDMSMNQTKTFKTPPELREYWRLHKRIEREKKRCKQ